MQSNSPLIPVIFNGYLTQFQAVRPDLVRQLQEAAATYAAAYSTEQLISRMRSIEQWQLDEAKHCVPQGSPATRLIARAQKLLKAVGALEPWATLMRAAESTMEQIKTDKNQSVATCMIAAMAAAHSLNLFVLNAMRSGECSNDELASSISDIRQHTSSVVYYWGTLVAIKNGELTSEAQGLAYERLAAEILKSLNKIN